MKRLLPFLLLASSLSAQTASRQTCTVNLPSDTRASYPCTFASNVLAGATLVLPGIMNTPQGPPVVSITDSQGNTWTKDTVVAQLQFWHTTAAGGPETVTVGLSPAGAFVGTVAEYPPSTAVTVTSIANGSGTSPVSRAITTTGSGILIGFGTQWTNSYEAPLSTGTGFSAAKFGAVYLEDESVSAAGSATASATYGDSVNWFIGAAFLSTTPSATLTVTGSACYDTGASLFGQNPQTISILQLENNVWTTVGNPTVAPNCSIGGTVTVNPNFADSNGNVSLSASLPVLTGTSPPLIMQVPITSIGHNSAGVTITLILFQNAPGGVKAAGIALTP